MTLSQIWPPVQPRTLERAVWDSTTAAGLPGMAKALQLYGGLIGSCVLDEVQGSTVVDPRPGLLEQPDPDEARSLFVRAQVEDWWLHGNACHLITSRSARTGWPTSVRYFPAHRWAITEDRATGQPVYHLDGQRVPRGDVVHVKRGVDPRFPWRGMGVVEQHLRTLNRAGLEESAESAALTDRGTPAVAIITPQEEPAEADLTAAADKWVEKFRGPEPKPAFFPKGTEVVPLSWNPQEGQMVEARKMTAVDLANLMNLDGYWLGAEASSHNYKSPGLMFLHLTKTSLGPVMDPFEDVWSQAWLPRGSRVRFDRVSLLRDDLGTMVSAFTQGREFFPDRNEVRAYMGFPPLPDSAWPAVPPQLQDNAGDGDQDNPAQEPADVEDDEDTTEGTD